MTDIKKEKALIAMSGGVDSSVAAYLTMLAGYICTGCMMKLYEGEVGSDVSSCCSADDAEDARAVAHRLGIPFYVFNYTERFKSGIIDRFTDYYLRGLTPNPCIDCNRLMKFGALMQRADELGCRYVVTGHYARIERDGGSGLWQLKKAKNPAKDQSYVLYQLTQEQLSRILLPLGGMDKGQVRGIAGQQGFINAHKSESQDICFIPDGNVADAVRKYTGTDPAPGNFVDSEGRILGRHRGICSYTIGQRRGLGIAHESPLYVCRIDVEKNRIVLGSDSDLFSDTAHLRCVNWISGSIPEDEVRCSVRIRYHAPEVPATVKPLPEGAALVSFDRPVRAVTPGQSAVFYDGDTVLGGGEIV